MGITQHINFIIQITVFKLRKTHWMMYLSSLWQWENVRKLLCSQSHAVFHTSSFMTLRDMETCNHLQIFTSCFMKVWNNCVKVLGKWHHICTDAGRWMSGRLVLSNLVTFVVEHAKWSTWFGITLLIPSDSLIPTKSASDSSILKLIPWFLIIP